MYSYYITKYIHCQYIYFVRGIIGFEPISHMWPSWRVTITQYPSYEPLIITAYGFYNLEPALLSCFSANTPGETRTRTPTTEQGILSPLCLPIPPQRHSNYIRKFICYVDVFIYYTIYIIKCQPFI